MGSTYTSDSFVTRQLDTPPRMARDVFRDFEVGQVFTFQGETYVKVRDRYCEALGNGGSPYSRDAWFFLAGVSSSEIRAVSPM